MKTSYDCGFSTLGIPEASFEAVCDLAASAGLDFVELRALGGTTDLAAAFQAGEWRTPMVPVRLVATSLCLLEAREQDLESFYQLAELAQRLRAPYLRIFGNGGSALGAAPGPDQLRAMARLVQKLHRWLDSHGCASRLLLETHGAFSSSERCLALYAELDAPLGILWDSHHTWRLGNESPEATWQALRPHIAHVHYKDSVTDTSLPNGFRYVSPGKGEYPTRRLANLLVHDGYAQGVSLEWERMWHPELGPLAGELASFREAFSS